MPLPTSRAGCPSASALREREVEIDARRYGALGTIRIWTVRQDFEDATKKNTPGGDRSGMSESWLRGQDLNL